MRKWGLIVTACWIAVASIVCSAEPVGHGDPARLARLHRLLQDRRPPLDFDKLLFVKRKTYQSNHYYTDYINGCRYYGGNLCVMDLKTGRVTDLLPQMCHGIFGKFDLSFDAQRIVFAWKKNPDTGFHIYECRIDGSGLRQLTGPPPHEEELVRRYNHGSNPYKHYIDDMDPCYLPDGGIAFISTRCQYGILCDSPDLFTTTVLYRMDADGRNMQKLTNSSVSEATPAVTNDGRLLYTRWEYVNKGAVSIKCLWSMFPDGSNSIEVFGNTLATPPTLLHARPVPGRNNLFVVLGTPHCPQSGVGTVILIDTSQNIRTRDPMTYITPDIDIREEGGFHFRREGRWVRDRSGKLGWLYMTPYALSDKIFLVSAKPAGVPWNDPDAWGLYLMDEYGNRLLIHEEQDISCWQPVPLKPRPVPPVIGSNFDQQLASRGLARVTVTDIYRGMSGIERGTIKYIRVLEQVPRPWTARRPNYDDLYDQQHAVITKDTHLGLKVQHGVVPVEPDGSANFLVPADRNIFFQTLDGNYMAVQTERTYVNYRPGEVRSCVGCHTTPNDSPPPPRSIPLALRRPPDTPGPQPGETTGRRPLHYPADVQPVLDRHCVRCHNGKPGSDPPDLTGTPTRLFSRSYENLLNRKYMPIIGENHPKVGNAEYLPPKSLGSHNSKLVKMLLDGHEGVKLSLPEMIKITNWVDTNGQFYGSYFGRRNLAYQGQPDFRPVPTWESAIGIAPHPPAPQADRQQ